MPTEPRLQDLHPWLQAPVKLIAEQYAEEHPTRRLCLIWAHRTPVEQAKEFAAGHTKLDGVNRFSLHNFLPSLAADLWIYEGASTEMVPLFEGRPPKELGLDLILMQPNAFKDYYLQMAELVERKGLEAGAKWARFKDGPHVQLDKSARPRLAQVMLREFGTYSGVEDGIFGPKSRAAAIHAATKLGVHPTETFLHGQQPLFPLHPKLWWPLCRAVFGSEVGHVPLG